jgi:hypothetical protein
MCAEALPPGLSFDPSTGVVSGTPSGSGAYPFAAWVTDAMGSSATRALQLNVSP